MMRKEIRISSDRAQEMLKAAALTYPPGQDSALHQEKTKSEMTGKGH